MKASIQLRLSQHLALTPQLQQSIRLLQLSTLELNQELEQALLDNPLLERDDDPLAGAESSGIEHARADLFDGAIWYLTPTRTSSGVLYERLHRFDAADESIRKSLGQFGQAATGGGANVQKAAYIQSAQDGEQPLHAGVVVHSLMGMHGVVARGSFGVIPALGENRIIDSRFHIVIR